ncbi:MAG: hypothetical protein WDN47_04675 [Candidatus Doudnabacteria bacterium]
MRQRRALVVLVALSMLGMVGCNKLSTQPSQIMADSPPGASSQSGAYQVTVAPDGTTTISNPAGQQIDPAGLEAIVAAGGEIGLNLTDGSLQSRTNGRLNPSDVGVNLGVAYIYVGSHDSEPPHPLAPCVTNPVDHFHITIKANVNTPDSKAWSHLHIGTATTRNGSGVVCKRFVIYDSRNKWLCLATPPCPNFHDLQIVIQNAMQQSLSAVGINLYSWLLSGAAGTIAGAIWGLLLAL